MHTTTRIAITVSTILAAIVVAAGVGARQSDHANAATGGVSIKNFSFSPATLSIRVGDQVRWINDETSGVPHNITPEKYNAFAQSGTLSPGDSFSTEPFTAAGSYPYLCLIHPSMRGVINVGDATGSPSAPLPALAAAPISLTLSGSNEVPAVRTLASGQFRGTASATSITWAAQVYGSGIIAGHIHQGAAGTNGPVVAFLFGPDPGQNILNLSGTVTEANLVGPLAGKMADFQKALAAGNLYVNFHTVANPGGEIRAQIPGSGGAAPGAPATGNTARAGSSRAWPALFTFAIALAGAGVLAGARIRRR